MCSQTMVVKPAPEMAVGNVCSYIESVYTNLLYKTCSFQTSCRLYEQSLLSSVLSVFAKQAAGHVHIDCVNLLQITRTRRCRRRHRTTTTTTTTTATTTMITTITATTTLFQITVTTAAKWSRLTDSENKRKKQREIYFNQSQSVSNRRLKNQKRRMRRSSR